MTNPTCIADECERQARSSRGGLCDLHRKRVRRNGTTELTPFVPKVCSLPDCERLAVARGVCGLHWGRWQRRQTYDPPTRGRGVCSIEDCEGLVHGHGWCHRHYLAFTEPTKFCSLEDCDLPLYGKGLCRKHWQRRHRTGNTALAAKTARPLCGSNGCTSYVGTNGINCPKHHRAQRPRRPPKPSGPCAADGCIKPAIKGQWCGTHADRLRRLGRLELPPSSKMQFLTSLTEPTGGCVTWPWSKNANGYGLFKALGEITAHRVACRVFHGPPPAGKPWAIHSCGQGHLACVAPWHLRWGSVQDNSDDAVAHGTIPRGIDHIRAKLDDDKVREIRASGLSQRALARMYGVSRGAIASVLRGDTWKHVV